MPKVVLLLSLVIFYLFPLALSKSVLAAECTATYTPTDISENTPIEVSLKGLKDRNYHVFVTNKETRQKVFDSINTEGDMKTYFDGQLFTIKIPGLPSGVYDLSAKSFTIGDSACLETSIQVGSATTDTACVAWITNVGEKPILKRGDPATLKALGNDINGQGRYVIDISGSGKYDKYYNINFTQGGLPRLEFAFSTTTKQDGSLLADGTHTVSIIKDDKILCATSFSINEPGAPTAGATNNSNPPICTEVDIKSGKCTKAGGEPCANNPDGIQTAIGCINTKPEALIEDVFKLAVGVGGGIAFLLMVFGAFGMVTSAGNPEALKESQQRFVNAIIGILFIVFSTLLLQIIGVDILGIPGFKK